MNAIPYFALALFVACQGVMLAFFLKRGREHSAEHARMFGPGSDAALPITLRCSEQELERIAASAREVGDSFVTIPVESFRMLLDEAWNARALAAQLRPKPSTARQA